MRWLLCALIVGLAACGPSKLEAMHPKQPKPLARKALRAMQGETPAEFMKLFVSKDLVRATCPKRGWKRFKKERKEQKREVERRLEFCALRIDDLEGARIKEVKQGSRRKKRKDGAACRRYERSDIQILIEVEDLEYTIQLEDVQEFGGHLVVGAAPSC